MTIIAVLPAMVEKTLISRVCAWERRLSGPRWLQRSFGSDLPRFRLCDCGIVFASFERWVLRAWRDLHMHMLRFQ